MERISMRTGVAAALAFAALAGTQAEAADLGRADSARSSAGFAFKQMGVPSTGKFSALAAQVQFDPDKPEAAKAEVEVDLRGVDAGSAEANGELASKQWFDTAAYPKARFVSKKLRKEADGSFAAEGDLTVKGKTLPATIRFKVEKGASGVALKGSFPMSRSKYGIGQGQWADVSLVADEVTVNFSVAMAGGK